MDSISIVIPVTERGKDLIRTFDSYYRAVSGIGIKFEFIIVLIPEFEYINEQLKAEKNEYESLQFILLNRNYGEAGVLKIGIDHAQYEHVLTLPPYEQVSPDELPKVIKAFGDTDALIVNRWPRIDPAINQFQSSVFKFILKLLSYNVPKDSGSGIRLATKEVFNDIRLYGDLHRFFQLLVEQAGFKISEIDIPQSQKDAHPRIYSPRTYLSRALDILTVGFLTRFNKKPLRFFGTGGAISSLLGLFGLGYIAVERVFFGVPAADRPLLVLFSIFLVLGVQLIAIGLVGETIIFTNSKENKEYRIRKIIN